MEISIIRMTFNSNNSLLVNLTLDECTDEFCQLVHLCVLKEHNYDELSCSMKELWEDIQKNVFLTVSYRWTA